MASSVTLAQLRLDARLYADQRPGSSSTFISDTELTRLVNQKARELYELLVSARGASYYASSTTISIVGGTADYDLPADFFELESIILEWAENYNEPMDPVMTTKERAWYKNWRQWSRWTPKGYQLRQNKVTFMPTPQSSVTARVYYVPVYVDMVADGDTFDGINGWEKMLTVGVALEMLSIDKRSNAQLAGFYAEQMKRIDDMKTERDAESPKTVVDVNPDGTRRGMLLPREGVFGDTFTPTFD